MVVGLADQQRDRLAGGLQGRGEIARLTLELRRLIGAVGQDHRAVDAGEMPLCGQRLLHRVSEFHIGPALRQPRRLEIIQA